MVGFLRGATRISGASPPAPTEKDRAYAGSSAWSAFNRVIRSTYSPDHTFIRSLSATWEWIGKHGETKDVTLSCDICKLLPVGPCRDGQGALGPRRPSADARLVGCASPRC